MRSIQTKKLRECVPLVSTSGHTTPAWSVGSVATALAMDQAAAMRVNKEGIRESELTFL